MFWVAIEDTGTYEVSEFDRATEDEVDYLMTGYKVDKHDAEKFRMGEVQGNRHIVYEGVTYKGGFGYNVLVAKKCLEL